MESDILELKKTILSLVEKTSLATEKSVIAIDIAYKASKDNLKYSEESIKSLNEIKTKIDENYSKRELDAHFQNLNEKLDSLIIQTTKTNGRVTECEKKSIDTDGRISTITKFGIGIWAITIPVTLAYYFLQEHNIEANIDSLLVNQKVLLDNTK